MKSYKIILTEDDIDDLTYDYMCVENTVKKIIEQAKKQGYINSEEESNKPTMPTEKLTKDYMTTRIIEFQQRFMNYDIGKHETMRNLLNKRFIELTKHGVVSTSMFDFQGYDCSVITSHISKKIFIQFNKRIKRIWTPKEKEELQRKFSKHPGLLKIALEKRELEFSHNLPFVDFCYQHCNPWILDELEKIMFQSL